MVNIDWKPKCIESNANIHRCEITRLTTPRHYSQLALGSIHARHHWRPSTNHHHRLLPLHFVLFCWPGASGLLCFSTIGQDWSGLLYLSSGWRSDHRLWRRPVSPSLRPRQKLLLLETGCANKATSSRLLLDSTDLHVGSWCTTRHDIRNVTVFWGGCFEIHSLDTISKDFCSTHLLHSFLATWSRVPPMRLGCPYCRINPQSSCMQCSFGFSILQIFPPVRWPNVKSAVPDFFLWGFVEFMNLITLWCLCRPK